ncbi:Secretin GspD 2 [Planctomycetaceae bacterium]|nr:Secretin GspD 2 [Planctomycetaceae bacterium]
MRKYLVLLGLVLFASGLCAQQPVAAKLTLTGEMRDIPVEEMIKWTSEYQKLKFLYQPTQIASFKVSIMSPTTGFEIPATAFFSVLQTFLKQFKLILSPFGQDTDQSVRFYEIMQATEAITQSENVVFMDDIAKWTDTSANFVTMVVNLKYADANAVRAALQNLVSRQGGSVNPIQGINSLILADYSYNIRRLAQIVQLMDQPPRSPRLEVINIDHIDAEELVQSLNNLLTQRRQLLGVGGQPRAGQTNDETLVSVEVAPYVNAIMVTGFDSGIELVRDLVKKLDIEIPGAATTGRIHYYPCKNVKAEDLAATLTDLLGVGVPLSTQPGGVAPVPGATTQNQANAPTIVSDINTNSLLVIATASDYVEIRKIIEKLDVRRPQVEIEAAILEVRNDDDFQFGVEIASVDGFAKASKEPRLSAGTNFGFSEIVDSSGVPIGTGGGVPAGRNPIFGQGGLLTLTKGSGFDIPLLVRFLKTQADTNILSQPSVLVNDNSPATIDITTEIQLTVLNNLGTGQGTNTTGGDFVEAGITLTVTPQISQDDYVTVEIDLDISAFVGDAPNSGVSPPRSRRRITTLVTVPNGNTIVIGGLKSAESSKSVSKIPFLGDIPLIGELFKSQRTVSRVTNLYIFVRPRIMRDANFKDLKDRSLEVLNEADKKMLNVPANKEFIDTAKADFTKRQKTPPGKATRSFDYQGLEKDKK